VTRSMGEQWLHESRRGGARLVLLQERRVLTLTGGATEYQPITDAADVLPYRFVTPWIRVLRSEANNLNITGIRFQFRSAPYLNSPNDEAESGTLFQDLSYNITVWDVILPGVAGSIFTQAPASGRIPPIESPGGLLTWSCSNLDMSNSQTVYFEIVLVCRES